MHLVFFMDFLKEHFDWVSVAVPIAIALLPPVNRALDKLTSGKYGKLGFEIVQALADRRITEEEIQQLLRERK